MTCKDCLHYELCELHWLTSENACKRFFADKSEWVHLPCKTEDRVFSIIITGGTYRVVTDRVYALKISTGGFYAETNWYVEGGKIGYNVFLTQEEAEKALAERRKDDGEIH